MRIADQTTHPITRLKQAWNQSPSHVSRAPVTKMSFPSLVRLDVLKELGAGTNFWINGLRKFSSTERNTMLWTIIVILVVLWLLGFIGHIGGGLIHLLLVIAVIVLVVQLIQGRRL